MKKQACKAGTSPALCTNAGGAVRKSLPGSCSGWKLLRQLQRRREQRGRAGSSLGSTNPAAKTCPRGGLNVEGQNQKLERNREKVESDSRELQGSEHGYEPPNRPLGPSSKAQGQRPLQKPFGARSGHTKRSSSRLAAPCFGFSSQATRRACNPLLFRAPKHLANKQK